MTFTAEQVAELSKPLDRANVKQRQQGGGKVSYIEAYHAENEANRIFGFDAWDRETDLALIGEREHDGKWRVYYRAKVRITVRSADGGVTVREGCGFGSGIDRDIGQAHESALKEAESDAEKRALKTFGNPFGQALYDKEQRDVVDPAGLPISDAQFAELTSLIGSTGTDTTVMCEHYGVSALKFLTVGQFEDAKARLYKRLPKSEGKAA